MIIIEVAQGPKIKDIPHEFKVLKSVVLTQRDTKMVMIGEE